MLPGSRDATKNMAMSRPAIATLLLLAVPFSVLAGSLDARAADPAERPHELGWLCMNVSDVGVSQISAFNKDAPSLSIWVPKARLYIEPTGPGTSGRVCAPAVVRLGDGELPPETLVFERTVISGNVHRPATAELVVTPESPLLGEVTVELIGLAEQWTQRDGTLTFQSVRPIEFPGRVTRGLIGDGEGPPPPDIFRAVAATQRFAEPCQPAVMDEAMMASFGSFEPRTNKVSARGLEPVRLEAGTKVSRCEGVALDTMLLAVARPATAAPDETDISWLLIPRQTKMHLVDEDASNPKTDTKTGRRYTMQRPLGGYHVCRQPTWTSSVLSDIPMAGSYELLPSGEWRQNLPGDASAAGTISGGATVTLLDYRDTWALVRGVVDGKLRVVAAPASSVAMPSGPAPDALEVDGGLCPVARGQWKALKSNAQAFKVSQDTPGAELDGLWLEIPMGTHLLQLCQDGADVGGKTIPGVPSCEPIFVGGAQQGSETDRFVLVRYAGNFLGVRAKDLRDKTTGEFELRRERPWFHRAGGIKQDDIAGWALSIGPGARLSFVRPDDHAWTISLYLQRLVEKSLGFEGGVGIGGDGLTTFLSFTGGVGTLLYKFEDEPLELRGAVLGQLDLRVTDGGGLNFDIIGKAQLRWVNDIAPVSFEVGLNIGYGGTFGNNGKGGVMFGMPFGILVELVQF